ncbi:Serine/threonine-protein kinase BUR1 [Lachnellula suecica]|uniref:Serine/threonine-protein kinase BUR1 n=1 Tax=Lachnellula suecica TaxID=602035 RepID=A0A8T9CLZ0_9HELO|nr:Serine/threonine-protein kinase BUR1 [Lachnellula suecica]
MATLVQHVSPQGNGVSPRAFAAQNARSANSFRGCSRITDYDILGKLGEGTFGEVHRAKSKKTGAIVALKKILMHNEKDGFPITALREIKLLKLLSHPNVLKLEEMAVEHHTKSTDKRKRAIMYMVTPYMDHDLSGLLENPSVKFVEPQIKCYMLQLLEGLRYLHDNKILHRDMKAANLLINNKGILQIADFGLARHYDESVPVAGHGGGEAHRDYTTLVVTRWYRPPELLLHLRKYTTAIDLWGVGCVFGEMLVGKPILAGDSDPNQLKIIFDLVGTPTEENMPGWKSLPGAEGLNFPVRAGSLHQRFRDIHTFDKIHYQHGQGIYQPLKNLTNLTAASSEARRLRLRQRQREALLAWALQVVGENQMETGILGSGSTQRAAMVDIAHTTTGADTPKADTAMEEYRRLHLRKRGDLRGDVEMMAGPQDQDYHQDHHPSITLMVEPTGLMGIGLGLEKLIANRPEVEGPRQTWTHIYPATTKTVDEEMTDQETTDEDETIAAMTVDITLIGGTEIVNGGLNTMTVAEVP